MKIEFADEVYYDKNNKGYFVHEAAWAGCTEVLYHGGVYWAVRVKCLNLTDEQKDTLINLAIARFGGKKRQT